MGDGRLWLHFDHFLVLLLGDVRVGGCPRCRAATILLAVPERCLAPVPLLRGTGLLRGELCLIRGAIVNHLAVAVLG